MAEREGSTPRIDNRFARVEVIPPQVWEEVRRQFPEVIVKYSIPLAIVVKRKYDQEALEERKKVTLIDLVDQMVHRTPPRVTFAEARQLGLSSGGLNILTEATVKLVAQETAINLPFAKGQGTDYEARRIQKIAESAQRARHYMETAKHGIEKRVLELLLTGEQTEKVAKVVSQELEVDPPLNVYNVNKIFDKASQRVDYLQPGRLRERALKAKQTLDEIDNNHWVNRKAQLTESVLYLLNLGYSRHAIFEELGISKNLYNGLVNEVFIELKEDGLGWQEFMEALEQEGISRSQLDKMGPYTVNKVSRFLIGPYRAYRVRIGEEVMSSGETTTKRASVRERRILETMAHGAQDRMLASGFKVNKVYMGLIADTLAGYSDVRKGYEAKLRERIDIYQRFKRDLESSSDNLRGLPQYIDGVSLLLFLELMAQNKTIHDTIRQVSEQTGKTIPYSKLFLAYSKLRAHYSNRP